jgi:ketosteroid isomerase-like protein
MLRPTSIIAALAIVFATPAYAQPTTVDQKTRQQAEAIVAQYVDALSKGDGQALTSIYGQNPIDITPFGKNTSMAQIQNEAQEVHKRGLTLTAKADHVEPLAGGQVVVITAPYTGSYSNNPATPHVRGNLMFVAEREGGEWKIRAVSASRQVTPSPQ